MKYFYLVLVFVLFIVCGELFSQITVESRTENSLLYRIIKSYESGEIDYATMIKNRIYALTNPELVDERFKIDKPVIEKCATTNILELKDLLERESKNGIPTDAINGFNGILTRPAKQKFLVSPSGRFRIHYDTTGTHAVYQPTVDVNPADGHPDYVNRCAEIFDYVYDVEINQMGYTPPPPDGTSGGGTNQYDVYMHSNSGAYGVTYSDGAVFNYGNPPRTAYKSYIHVDPTYNGFGYTDRTLPLKVTAAHEYFHAIQFAYNINAGNWFMEITATWIEDIIYDNINDYRFYLPAFFNAPQVSLTKFDGSHEYASCIFGHYISENFGNDRIKRIWDFTINAGSNSALNAIQNALNEIGTNRSDVFAGFTVWNYLTGPRANGSHPTYGEAQFFPQVNIAATYSSYPVSANAPSGQEFLGTFYYHFNSITTPSNLRLGFNQISSSQWKGKVVVDSSSRFKSYDVDLSTGSGLYDLLSFHNKTRAVFIPANVATSGTGLSYSYSANILQLPTVLYPNGGEKLYIDSSYNITWNAPGITNLKIEYTTNNGTNWIQIISSVPASTGSYHWVVPATPTNLARIKITSTTDPNLFDISNNVFTIQYTPYIAVNIPVVGDVFPIGYVKNIEWSSVNIEGNVKIELSRDNGNTYETLFANTTNDGIETWNISGPATEQAIIKISSINSPSIYGLGAGNFYIRNANLSLNSPNGGEIKRIGLEDTIKWTSLYVLGKVKIQISRDGGFIYENIIDSTDNDGEAHWTISGPVSSNARIRVVSLMNPNVYDESDNDFFIYPQNFIQINQPTSYDALKIDSLFELKWESFGTSGFVKIELSRDNGLTYQTLFPSTEDDGSEIWMVSGALSANSILKISDLNNTNLYDLSEKFIIGDYENIKYTAGWNLVSLSGYTNNRNKNAVFSPASSNAFQFNAGYIIKNELEYGEGYWLKFNNDGENTIISVPRLMDTIPVSAGWNLVGGISVPVATANIISIPDNNIASYYYGYNKGYYISDTLMPSQASWIKVNQDGYLVISDQVLNKNSNALNSNRIVFEKANLIRFSDKAGNKQMLLLTNRNEYFYYTVQAELPPLPPESVFDIRFQDNKRVEYYDQNRNEFTINIQNVVYPLKIDVKRNDNIGFIITIDGELKELISESGLVINKPLNSPIKLQVVLNIEPELPRDYVLHQNYPNPFNPSTLIKYEIPEDNFVTLKIYNVLGMEIKTLVNEFKTAGKYEVVFEADDNLSNGIYYYQLKTNKNIITKKAILLK